MSVQTTVSRLRRLCGSGACRKRLLKALQKLIRVSTNAHITRQSPFLSQNSLSFCIWLSKPLHCFSNAMRSAGGFTSSSPSSPRNLSRNVRLNVSLLLYPRLVAMATYHAASLQSQLSIRISCAGSMFHLSQPLNVSYVTSTSPTNQCHLTDSRHTMYVDA